MGKKSGSFFKPDTTMSSKPVTKPKIKVNENKEKNDDPSAITKLCSLLRIVQQDTFSLHQCWMWITRDNKTVFSDSNRLQHIKSILKLAPVSFCDGLYRYILSNNPKEFVSLYLLHGCPPYVKGLPWYKLIDRLQRAAHEHVLRQLSASEEARSLMGTSHVFVRLASRFVASRCLSVLVDHWCEENESAWHITNIIDCILMSLLRERMFSTQLQFSNSSIDPLIDADDFRDLLSLGWIPALWHIIEFPFEWLNVLIPIVYRSMLGFYLSPSNIWNFYDAVNLIGILNDTKTGFIAECTFLPHLKNAWKRIQSTNRNILRHISTRKMKRSDTKKWVEGEGWFICTDMQPFVITWRFLHPTVRSQIINLLQKAGPLIRQKFVYRVSMSAVVEMFKPSYLEDYFQMLLSSDTSGIPSCCCVALTRSLEDLRRNKILNNKILPSHKKRIEQYTHSLSCPVMMSTSQYCPVLQSCRPWFFRTFSDDLTMLFQDTLRQHYPDPFLCAPEACGDIVSVTHLLAVLYGKGLHVDTILTMLSIFPRTRKSFLAKEKYLREILSVLGEHQLYGQPNVCLRIQDKYIKQEESWLKVFRQVAKYLV